MQDLASPVKSRFQKRRTLALEKSKLQILPVTTCNFKAEAGRLSRDYY